ncbi:MAG TPA: hybrid sensor histidine kinase/response regulator [Candidatus Omnitrophica bacterium]|nr:hybrid sensor histidine kinase/response regulator [Candidatus Omnitrophota bacterium]
MIKRKILVVDDSPEARSAIQRVLVRAGFEVTQASSGKEALYILKQKKIDCVMLDHLMPEMNGLDVARIIKRDEKLKIIPVIMLTAVEDEDEVISGLNAGADDYILKTHPPDIIIARVEAMLRLGKLQGELFDKNVLLEKANADLYKLDVLKSEFISTVSHELRTPLSITKEGLKLVLEEVTGSINQQQKELLEVAKSNIERLSKIINDILDISKIEAGTLPLHKTLLDLNHIIKQVFSKYKSMAQEKDIKFTFDLPEHATEVYLDSDRIGQVLTNLVSNALKFTKENGCVEVRLEDKEQEVICSVEDTGVGIAELDLDKIFDKFQQFGKTPGPGERGTGLGLSIARKIIQMHKGRIWVKSELGKGTTFSVSIPKYSPDKILKSYIKVGVQDAEERFSKFSVLTLSISGLTDKVLLKAVEKHVKNILRRAGDNSLIYDNRIIVFLSDANQKSAESIKKRILDSCKDFLISNKHIDKKIHFKTTLLTYPEDVLFEDDLIKKIIA